MDGNPTGRGEPLDSSTWNVSVHTRKEEGSALYFKTEHAFIYGKKLIDEEKSSQGHTAIVLALLKSTNQSTLTILARR